MNLDELPIGVVRALLEDRGVCRARADHGVGRFAKDRPVAARRQNDGVGREGAELHRAQIQRRNAAPYAFGIDDRRQELPAFILAYLAFGFVATYLLIKRVQKLLARRGSCKGRPVVKRSAKPAKVEQALGRAVERHAHPVEQIDDRRRGFAHGLHRRLVG